MKKTFFAISLLLLPILFTSCAYHAGSDLASKYDSIALDEVTNVTPEADATYLMKNAMLDQLYQDPGLAVKSPDNADLILDVKVTNLEYSSYASVRRRDHHNHDDHRSSYVTSMRQMTVTVEYEMYERNNQKEPIAKGKVYGIGYMPQMPDLNMAVSPALRAALVDASAKIMFNLGYSSNESYSSRLIDFDK